jgi:hypothetical protein
MISVGYYVLETMHYEGFTIPRAASGALPRRTSFRSRRLLGV